MKISFFFTHPLICSINGEGRENIWWWAIDVSLQWFWEGCSVYVYTGWSNFYPLPKENNAYSSLPVSSHLLDWSSGDQILPTYLVIRSEAFNLSWFFRPYNISWGGVLIPWFFRLPTGSVGFCFWLLLTVSLKAVQAADWEPVRDGWHFGTANIFPVCLYGPECDGARGVCHKARDKS